MCCYQNQTICLSKYYNLNLAEKDSILTLESLVLTVIRFFINDTIYELSLTIIKFCNFIMGCLDVEMIGGEKVGETFCSTNLNFG